MQVNEAVELLNDYNSRLAAEMEERTKLAVMLRDFQAEQKELLAQAEKRLEVNIKSTIYSIDIVLRSKTYQCIKFCFNYSKELKQRNVFPLTYSVLSYVRPIME